MEKQKKVLVKDHINRKDFKMKKKKSDPTLYPIFPEEIREKSPLGKLSPRAAATNAFISLRDLITDKKKKGTKKKSTKKKSGGLLKDVPKDNVGLGKLPKPVRNEMGFKKKGGKVGKPLGCGKAKRGFGKGPYKKRGT